MAYSKLKIENFRGINYLEIEGFSNVNIILGKNNSSKTSILEAIFVLIGSLNPEILLRVNRFRTLNFNEQDDFRLVFNNLKYDENILIEGTIDKDTYRTLEIRPSNQQGKISHTKRTISADDLNELDYDSRPDDIFINQLTFLSKFKAKHSKEKLVESKLIFRNGEFISEVGNYRNSTFERAVFLTQSLQMSINLERELEDIIISKQQAVIIDALKIVDGNIRDITLGRNRMIFVDVGLNRMIPINLMGDGVRRMLVVILSIYNAKGGVVVIDEIENGLYFSTLGRLWKSIITTAVKLKTQVFVTTHNSETIKSLYNSLIDSDFKDNKDDDYRDNVMTFSVRKISEELHKSYSYSFDQLENAIEENLELR
ncbi:AAA family ATPase [Bizionia sp. KMM 8389]